MRKFSLGIHAPELVGPRTRSVPPESKEKISYQVTTSGLGGSWIPDSACSTNPCLNGGKCLIAWGGYECVCLSGYFGDTCEHDPCKIVVQNGGTETIEDFHCGGNKFFRGTQR